VTEKPAFSIASIRLRSSGVICAFICRNTSFTAFVLWNVLPRIRCARLAWYFNA
jgi:hypothetical protein